MAINESISAKCGQMASRDPPEAWELPLSTPAREAGRVELGAGAAVLTGYAADRAAALLKLIEAIGAAAPIRRMMTPGGGRRSVAMTNCGAAGWVTDQSGYRYTAEDPLASRPWPPMPEEFAVLAREAAREAGFAEFSPDACLINRYEPGARMSLHQDKDERDMDAPIVSVSLGLPALFLWGGPKRADRPRRIPLLHGDVVVWGGPSRLIFHGVHALPAGVHPLTGALRYNLTFRKAR
jgi:alkylated DNA repair protein (DNA oxidative demethylase)